MTRCALAFNANDSRIDNSISSFSALCSIEHFGLGRYGDPIDPEACFKCFDNIQSKIARSGLLYLSVPVGKDVNQLTKEEFEECYGNRQ